MRQRLTESDQSFLVSRKLPPPACTRHTVRLIGQGGSVNPWSEHSWQHVLWLEGSQLNLKNGSYKRNKKQPSNQTMILSSQD